MSTVIPQQQFELSLPRRTLADYQREQLSAAVEALNSEQDCARRAELFSEVQRLRAQLGIGGAT